ncbi:MAG: hypothetical protein VX699_09130 [Myxococcota bacterium]|nr:hypothetical protein [Myxococcota bacterium]
MARLVHRFFTTAAILSLTTLLYSGCAGDSGGGKITIRNVTVSGQLGSPPSDKAPASTGTAGALTWVPSGSQSLGVAELTILFSVDTNENRDNGPGPGGPGGGGDNFECIASHFGCENDESCAAFNNDETGQAASCGFNGLCEIRVTPTVEGTVSAILPASIEVPEGSEDACPLDPGDIIFIVSIEQSAAAAVAYNAETPINPAAQASFTLPLVAKYGLHHAAKVDACGKKIAVSDNGDLTAIGTHMGLMIGNFNEDDPTLYYDEASFKWQPVALSFVNNDQEVLAVLPKELRFYPVTTDAVAGEDGSLTLSECTPDQTPTTDGCYERIEIKKPPTFPTYFDECWQDQYVDSVRVGGGDEYGPQGGGMGPEGGPGMDDGPSFSGGVEQGGAFSSDYLLDDTSTDDSQSYIIQIGDWSAFIQQDADASGRRKLAKEVERGGRYQGYLESCSSYVFTDISGDNVIVRLVNSSYEQTSATFRQAGIPDNVQMVFNGDAYNDHFLLSVASLGNNNQPIAGLVQVDCTSPTDSTPVLTYVALADFLTGQTRGIHPGPIDFHTDANGDTTFVFTDSIYYQVGDFTSPRDPLNQNSVATRNKVNLSRLSADTNPYTAVDAQGSTYFLYGSDQNNAGLGFVVATEDQVLAFAMRLGTESTRALQVNKEKGIVVANTARGDIYFVYYNGTTLPSDGVINKSAVGQSIYAARHPVCNQTTPCPTDENGLQGVCVADTDFANSDGTCLPEPDAVQRYCGGLTEVACTNGYQCLETEGRYYGICIPAKTCQADSACGEGYICLSMENAFSFGIDTQECRSLGNEGEECCYFHGKEQGFDSNEGTGPSVRGVWECCHHDANGGGCEEKPNKPDWITTDYESPGTGLCVPQGGDFCGCRLFGDASSCANEDLAGCGDEGTCITEPDARDGYIGVCEKQLGEQCMVSPQCAGDLVCNPFSYECQSSCSTTGDCAEGDCVYFGSEVGLFCDPYSSSQCQAEQVRSEWLGCLAEIPCQPGNPWNPSCDATEECVWATVTVTMDGEDQSTETGVCRAACNVNSDCAAADEFCIASWEGTRACSTVESIQAWTGPGGANPDECPSHTYFMLGGMRGCYTAEEAPCSGDADCEEGYTCSDNRQVCVDQCETNADCSEAQICTNFNTGETWGADLSEDLHCRTRAAGEMRCAADNFQVGENCAYAPGTGTCNATAGTGCNLGDLCHNPEGGPDQAATPTCLCTDPATCTVGCTTDADCIKGTQCNTGSGACEWKTCGDGASACDTEETCVSWASDANPNAWNWELPNTAIYPNESLCFPGGAIQLGDTCAAFTDCGSLYCSDVCLTPCDKTQDCLDAGEAGDLCLIANDTQGGYQKGYCTVGSCSNATCSADQACVSEWESAYCSSFTPCNGNPEVSSCGTNEHCVQTTLSLDQGGENTTRHINTCRPACSTNSDCLGGDEFCIATHHGNRACLPKTSQQNTGGSSDTGPSDCNADTYFMGNGMPACYTAEEPPCQGEFSCGAGYTCLNNRNVCVEKCSKNSDCSEDQICTSFAGAQIWGTSLEDELHCRAKASDEMRCDGDKFQVGDNCAYAPVGTCDASTGNGCQPGDHCHNPDMGGDMAATPTCLCADPAACTTGCSSDSDCSDGTQCNTASGACEWKTCQDAITDCDQGEACINWASSGASSEPWSIPTGLFYPRSGICIPQGQKNLGESCSEFGDCQSLLCKDVCLTPCDTNQECIDSADAGQQCLISNTDQGWYRKGYCSIGSCGASGCAADEACISAWGASYCSDRTPCGTHSDGGSCTSGEICASTMINVDMAGSQQMSQVGMCQSLCTVNQDCTQADEFCIASNEGNRACLNEASIQHHGGHSEGGPADCPNDTYFMASGLGGCYTATEAPCKGESGCENGYTCHSTRQICIDSCATNADCSSEQICTNFTTGDMWDAKLEDDLHCVTKASGQMRCTASHFQVGANCAYAPLSGSCNANAGTGCNSGDVCHNPDSGGGPEATPTCLCTDPATCTTGCSSDDDCISGTHCETNTGACRWNDCTSTANDCHNGEVCVSWAADDNPDAWHMELPSATIYPERNICFPGGPKAIFAACDTFTDCQSLYCDTVCKLPCTKSQECLDGGAGDLCLIDNSNGGGESGQQGSCTTGACGGDNCSANQACITSYNGAY